MKDNRDPEIFGKHLLAIHEKLPQVKLSEIADMFGDAEAGNLTNGDARTNGKVMKGEGVVQDGEN